MKFIIKELWFNFDYKEKKRFFFIFLMMFLALILETFVVSQVYFIIKILMKQKSDFFSFLNINVIIESTKYSSLVIYSLFYLNIIYFIKNIYISFFVYLEKKYIAEIQLKITENLFKSYMNRPYVFHTENNSSSLVNKVFYESQFFESTLTNVLTLVTEILLLFFMLALLIKTELAAGVTLAIFFILVSIIMHKVIAKKINLWSASRFLSSNESLRNLNFFFHSFKILKILGKENNFISSFSKNFYNILHFSRLYKIAISYPRLFFEFCCVFGFTMLGFVVILQSRDYADIIPITGLFGAAAFRILPSFNRVTTGFQALQNAKPVLINLLKDLKYKIKDTVEINFIDKFPSKLTFENISYHHSNSQEQVIKNLNFEIEKFDCIGIVGESGAGKTTFINLLLGLFHPTAGIIKLDNKEIDINTYQFRGCVGFVPQSIYLSDDTLVKNIAYAEPDKLIDPVKVKEAIDLSGLSSFINSLPLGLETVVGEDATRVSGGQRQRIAIAQSLYHRPDLIIFDEATSSLDISAEEKILESIQKIKRTKTLIIVSHRQSTLKYCDKIFEMKNGSLQLVNSEKK
jgi:ABC-type bacteriocin/lantibiotic exporter with double-glycine peptidase domain